MAGSAVLMVGGYDGSGNFGDVLQLAGAIEAYGPAAARCTRTPLVSKAPRTTAASYGPVARRRVPAAEAPAPGPALRGDSQTGRRARNRSY